jgi:hypothetical protein
VSLQRVTAIGLALLLIFANATFARTAASTEDLNKSLDFGDQPRSWSFRSESRRQLFSPDGLAEFRKPRGFCFRLEGNFSLVSQASCSERE